MQVVVCSFQQFVVVVPALAFAPFGIPAPVFWIYVCALVIFIIGLIKILGELRQEHGVDKIMPVGRLFFAIPLAVFGSEHFTFTANVAALVPRWIPAHTFWVYLVGVAFFAAALSIAVLFQARLAAALVGMTMLIFVLVMDLPAVVANPGNRFFWALALRQLAFSGGAFAFAMCLWSPQPRQALRQSGPTLRTVASAIPRFFVGITSLFYGVEHLLHPEYVPGVPLEKLTPEWIPGRVFLSYFVGVILILAGVCLLVNKKARTAATCLGLTILLTVLWIYLPMLLTAPTDVVALNFFFDTMLFSGAILLLANSIDKEPVARI
ncbi:MAG: YjgN family protein [Pyrinomonadaceae bacterium]|nr:YjgN family protein [Pyrinomonadaceae bacterium]